MFYLNIYQYINYIVVRFFVSTTNRSVLYHTIIFPAVPSIINYDSEKKVIPRNKPAHVYAELVRRVIDEHILVN